MIKVTTIDWIGGHRLRIRFGDETVGEYDFARMVSEKGPIIEPLRDPDNFRCVFIEDGAPTWPNGFDLAPAWLRAEMQEAGARQLGASRRWPRSRTKKTEADSTRPSRSADR